MLCLSGFELYSRWVPLTTIRRKTGLNQWKNSTSVINWFSSIQDKHQHTFAVFDIENFYPSITEKLLTDAITFAKQHTSITDRDIDIIIVEEPCWGLAGSSNKQQDRRVLVQ